MHKANPIRLAIVITNPQGLDVFFRQQVQTLQSCGVEVHAISGDGPDLLGFEEATGIRVRRVSIQRRISPLADLIATYRIWQAVREIRPDVVHAHTPKSGLLGMVAAVAAGVKVRYFTFHGLRTETLAGWRGALVRTTDRLTATLATH